MAGRRTTRCAGRAIAATVFAITLSGVARDAHAYCRTTTCDPKVGECAVDKNGCGRSGAPLSWRGLPIVYRFHAHASEHLQRDEAREAVRSAFQRWSDVTCASGNRTSLRFEEQDDIAAKFPATPHQRGAEHFGIYFRDDAWKATDSDSTLALTTQTFGLVNGWIDQSDIEINTANTTFATSDSAKGTDLQAVTTHEVGHYLGLAHSKDPDSIMVSSYCGGDGLRCKKGKVEARRLSADDEKAVCALFPPGGQTGVLYQDPAAASCSAATAGNAHEAAGYLPLAAIAFAFAAARRRGAAR